VVDSTSKVAKGSTHVVDRQQLWLFDPSVIRVIALNA
jgi:hypothetical protein